MRHHPRTRRRGAAAGGGALIPLPLALLAPAATAQVSPILASEYDVEDCRARILPGTVPYQLGRQSIETNAQAYSAEALVSRSIARGSNFALQLNNVYGVTRLPAVAVCGDGQMFGTAALDLFASASAVAVPIPIGSYRLRLFYAGSVTGSAIHYPDGSFLNNRYYTSWAYAGFGYLATFAAPAAPLISRDQGLQTMAGDFIAGASFTIPHAADLGSLDVGYVYSSGLYSNVSSQRLALFATTMITDQFTLLALLRAGVSELPIVKREIDKIGSTSLYGRNMVLEAPTADAVPQERGFRGLFADKAGGIDLTTVHLEQHRIGQYVSVAGALALRPRLFLHEGSVAVELPATALIDGMSDGVLDDVSLFSGRIGVAEMPALPWYATEGGRQLFVELDMLDMVHVRRNAPSTLAVFPYAQGAWELSIVIDGAMFAADRDEEEAP